jgi:DICT domain-containing protein
VEDLSISQVAEQTGLAPGTIRIWEQRFGFPEPRHAPSGHRVYTPEDVRKLRRVVAYRRHGFSMAAAVELARAGSATTDLPSIYGPIASEESPAPSRVLRKRALIGIAHAMEDEALACPAPVVVAAFQRRRHFESVEARYRRLAEVADACVAFADFPEAATPDREPWRIPIAAGAPLAREWAVVIEAGGYAACLLAWETPESRPDDAARDRDRLFETYWTLDPRVVRRALLVAAALVRRSAPEAGERMEALLRDRPPAVESPTQALTALTTRILDYMHEER